ncbi:two-component sensor histidine kinase [Sphaerisporangium siamense]|uniref:histidine kinase n=1 Tax=Sphaerisporangium siamense TaxID=795645 RepID=A0A7W7D5J6_9ACTN|nr:HAMP domain-containing sensor histidine kinase [Sphaerisporangium siamense]MBB4699710.1 signal transduction histidine kinase [Sphaerisporangium siamense]GII87889.1 two-component sensor histidine kinase [Sphaerisporangium siamense]
MRHVSLRWKVAALITLACCAVAAVVGALVHRTTLERAMWLGEARALESAETIAKDYRAGAPAEASAPWTEWIKSPDDLPPPLRERLAAASSTAWPSSATWYDDRNPEQPWMWAAQRVDGGRVATSRIEMGSERLRLRALDRAMVRAALTALVVVVPVSVGLAELANRRLRRVAVTARRIADGDLDARVGGKGHATGPRGLARWAGSDEIAGISAAVDSMAASLQYRLLAEQRFTADVAHDLRTPLMGMLAAAELLDDGEAADLVRDRLRVLRALVEDLLEVSRLDAGAEVAERIRVPLAELAERSAARVGVDARVVASGDPVAETDPRRLDRIVANLVLNACRHGEPPVEITVEDHAIEVRDHGPGFPPELLSDGPRRFRTGAAERGRGHGLGLTIALGQAGVIGADLTLANAHDGGAVATLRLPRRAPESPR